MSEKLSQLINQYQSRVDNLIELKRIYLSSILDKQAFEHNDELYINELDILIREYTDVIHDIKTILWAAK